MPEAVSASRESNRSGGGRKSQAIASIFGIFAVVALAPLAFGPYGLRVVTTILMYVALAQSWNLIGGYAGLISLAHPAFFGTGAVVSAICLINGAPIAIAVIVSFIISLLVALIVGVPTLRLQGHYFVAATLLVSEALRNFVLNLNAFNFHGGIAVNIIGYLGLASLGPEDYNRLFFYLMLALALGAMLIVFAVERSRWGLALRSIRDNEAAASALGVAASRVKVLVFLLSAGMASLIGTAWAFWLGTTETNEAYNLLLTFQIIVMVFLGGKGTLWGPVIGVVLVLLLNELIGIEFAEITQVISGLIVVFIVLFQPDGLISIVREGPAAFASRRLFANFRRYRVA